MKSTRQALLWTLLVAACGKSPQQAGGFRLITLQVDGQPHMSLARDLQQHPLTRTILHADFQEIVMTEKVTIAVPLHFAGESSAVKAGLGMILRSREVVQIEALPGDLIDFINVDLGQLTPTNLAIHVSDLKVPDTVRIATDGGETIALVVAMKEDKRVLLQFGANWCGWCHRLHKLFPVSQGRDLWLQLGGCGRRPW